MTAGSRQPDECPGCVSRAVDAERQPALLLVDAACHQRIARSGADALADPVHKADGQHPAPGVGKVQEGFCKGREAVPGDDQELPLAQFVGERAGIELDDAGGGLRHAFDQADDRCPHAEHVGQEQGDQVDDHLRGDVGQEGAGGHHPYVTRQAAPAGFLFC